MSACNFANRFGLIQFTSMQITYCINDDQIQLYEPPLIQDSVGNKPLEINLKKCAYPLSVMHISGEIKDRSDISFVASAEKGIVVCIQVIKNGYLTEFNTSDCMEMDYCKDIVDIRFIDADIPFKFKYTNGGTLRRIDIFFPQKNVSYLLEQSIISLLQQEGHFVIKRTEMKSIAKKIETILRASDSRDSQERLCSQVDKLVQLIKKIF